jgi:hypothetical protein
MKISLFEKFSRKQFRNFRTKSALKLEEKCMKWDASNECNGPVLSIDTAVSANSGAVLPIDTAVSAA